MSEEEQINLEEMQREMEARAAAETTIGEAPAEASELEKKIEEAQRRAQLYDTTIPEVPQAPFGTGSLREKAADIMGAASMLAGNEALFKLLGGSSDDTLKMFVLYMIWSDMQDRKMFRILQMKALMGDSGIKPEDIRRIVAEEIKKYLPQRKPVSDIDMVLKIVEKLKPSESAEIAELKKKLDRLEDEEIKAKLARLEEKIEEKLATTTDPMAATKAALEFYKQLKEILEPKKEGEPGSLTTTVSPLSYRGTAPWFLHPDTREALKDLITTAMREAGEILKIYYSLKGQVPIQAAASPAPAPAAEEELPTW